MFSTPLKLREICLEYLRESISIIYCPKDMVIDGDLTEDLLKSLSANNQLTDEVLLMPIFDSTITQLRHVRIPNASQLSTVGLKVLRTHRVNELEIRGLIKCTVDELISCLGEWSLLKLRYLKISHSSFTSSDEFYANFQSLQVLDVSHTQFNDRGLKIVVKDLPCLQRLNISATHVMDITPLLNYNKSLKSLSMYNLRSTSGSCDEFVPILIQLNLLKYLDISDEWDNPLQDDINEILKNPQCFKYLESFDISGKNGIDSEELKKFIAYKQQLSSESLKFLGLMNTSVCFEDYFSNPQSHDTDLVVTGNATESQIIESLRRYKQRPNFVEESLFNLFDYILTYCEPISDLIDLIIILMREHSEILSIQTIGTACLYNLTMGELSKNLHPKVLKKVINATLNAMQMFPNEQHLQETAILTLFNGSKLNISLDKFKCIQLVMDYLVTFKDVNFSPYAIHVCSILAFQIPPNEKSKLGSEHIYMETLLDIVRSYVQIALNNVLLESTLGILWNLTDESPKTCETFLEKSGLDLYLLALNTYVDQGTIEVQILGLLCNFAEVSYLRLNLMKLEFLTAFRNLIHSPQIDVSYFAVGIFANLCSDGIQNWSCSSMDFNTILDELMKVILNWEAPAYEICFYRSFRPFITLLKCFESPAIQLWATWAIHHACSKDPERYCQMSIEENVTQVIETIYQTTKINGNESLKSLCGLTLDIIKEEFPNFIH